MSSQSIKLSSDNLRNTFSQTKVPRGSSLDLTELLFIMTTRLALKSYKYALFYFPLDDTLEAAKTSKITSGMANIKERSMVKVNWDSAHHSIPAKIIALAGKWWFLIAF